MAPHPPDASGEPAQNDPRRSIRMRCVLSPAPGAAPFALPEGFAFAPFEEADADSLHALFAAAYANGFGDIGAFQAWRDALFADPEYDPGLVFTVRDSQGTLAAAAQCWTGAFIKDFAVREDCRRLGLGRALLVRVLAAFAARGASHADLKVVAANAPARALYARMGFTESP